jgi:uncharacterized protein YodC (DUF2158 family)
MFKPGDMVIKNSGGNKMRVTESSSGLVTCIWATDTIQTASFPEAELMFVELYELRSAQQSDRQDKINQLL